MAVFEIDGFTGKRDDAFHAVGAIGRIAQHNDLAAARRAEVVDPAVEKILIRIMQSWLHAGADDLYGLEDVAADEEIAGGGEHADHDALAQLLHP